MGNDPTTATQAGDDSAALRSPGVRYALAMVVLACVLPVTIFAASLIYYYFVREQARISDSVVSRARAMVSVVDREFATVQASLRALATHESLFRGDMDTFRARALKALESMESDSIYVVDDLERLVATTRMPSQITLPSFQQPPLLRLMERTLRPGVSDLFNFTPFEAPVIAVGVPVVQDGRFLASLNATMDPKHFLGLIEEQRLDPTWRVAIVDSAGTVVARSHEMSRFVGQKVNAELIERLARTREDAFASYTLDRVPVISVFSRSPSSQWAVVIGIPRAELSANLYDSLAWLICAALASLAIGLAIAWRVGGRIARSITALADPARRIGDGGSVDLPKLHFREAVVLGSALQSASESLEKARHEAQHDALTSLPNRVQFRDAVERELETCRTSGREFAVLVIDLDGFKQVNDTLGHAAGDVLLTECANRLRNAIRGTDLPARLGGDEFAVCLRGTALEGARRAAQKLVEVLSRPYTIDDHEAFVSASIGVGVYPATAGEADMLVKRADQAMYEAKSRGKNQVSVAVPG